MHFIETAVFTKQITSLLDDADYRQLQVTLALKPRAGRGEERMRETEDAVGDRMPVRCATL